MTIRNTILGWLRSTRDKDEKLEDEGAAELTHGDDAPDPADHVLWTGRVQSIPRPGEFERDQDGPRR